MVEPEGLFDLPEAELRQVEDLTIRRPGVGEVLFHGTIDLVADGLLQKLPQVLRLQPGEVVLYPEPGTKPPRGQGLNRPASISLLGCAPLGNGSGAFVDEESKTRYRARIKKMTEAKGAKFLDYDCDLWVWRFQVDYF